VNLRKILFYFP